MAVESFIVTKGKKMLLFYFILSKAFGKVCQLDEILKLKQNDTSQISL